ncbi:MAG: DUF853 family protein [Oligoflexia bacterium]|nr:DUF853 family protein [Oligoflexia bacterium]
MISDKKDKTLEDFFEELLNGSWALIQFSLFPVKVHSKIGGFFENFIRSSLFYGLILGCFFLYCFSHNKHFSPLNYLWFFFPACFLFLLRHWLLLNSLKKQGLIKKPIKTENLKQSKKLNFKDFPTLLEDKDKAPIGLSLISKKPVFLDVKDRCQHTIVSGATGQGKTTLLKTLLSHSLKHGHPIIIIDPKGEKDDILEMKKKARFYNREKDFCLFSLSFPSQSFSYNPLLNGKSEQIKARLMDGLQFTEEYYKAQASLFLGGILSSLKFLNKPISFSLLDKYLNDSSALTELKNEISAKESDTKSINEKWINRSLDSFSNSKNSKMTEMIDELALILDQISAIPKKDLAGLQAQISSINCLEFRNILSPINFHSDHFFSFSDILRHKKLAYFQLNVNGFGEISRQIGKMILQDLKVLSNQIQAGQQRFSYDFCSCFIDEFGSFATKDFADFLKMARSSRIGIHLFCQGLSDLSSITPDFKNQIVGNTINKIVFRQDVSSDAEEWAKMAGTFSSKKKTYQIMGSESEEEMTGLGSLRNIKEMKIEFDIFKNLSKGEAVLIDKADHKEDLLQVWRPIL